MKTILAIQPTGQRIGFAILRGVTLKDQGIKVLGQGTIGCRIHQRGMPFIRVLIEKHNPDVVVLPIPTEMPQTGRNRFLRALTYEHRRHQYQVVQFSRREIRAMFRHFLKPKLASKHRIMQLVTSWFPGLLEFLPRPRRAWDTANYWEPMFDAISFAITHLHNEK